MDSIDPSTARGRLRDAIAAVASIGEMARSRRIRGAAIARQIPEILRDAIPSLRQALDEVMRGCAAQVDGDAQTNAALAALIDRAADSIRRLELGLEAARTDRSQHRLALEALVRDRLSEIEAVLHLTDLLTAAAEQRPTAIELGDVLAMAGCRPVLPSAPVVQLELAIAEGAMTGDARVVGALLGCGLAWLGRRSALRQRVESRRRSDGRLVARISPAPPLAAGERRRPHLELTLGACLPEGVAVAQAAARRVGLEVSFSSDPLWVTLVA